MTRLTTPSIFGFNKKRLVFNRSRKTSPQFAPIFNFSNGEREQQGKRRLATIIGEWEGWLHVRAAITGDNVVSFDTYLFMQIFIIHRKHFNCISTVTRTLHAFIKYGKMALRRFARGGGGVGRIGGWQRVWVAYGEFSKEILIGPRRVSSLLPRFIFAQATHSRDLNIGETREFDLPRNRPSLCFSQCTGCPHE